MKKMFLGAVLVLVLSFGFAVYYVLFSLDGMVKTTQLEGEINKQLQTEKEKVDDKLKGLFNY